MAYEFNPYYFENNATERDYLAVNKFADKLEKTVDEMSTVDEVYSLIKFFETKGVGCYPLFFQSMCFNALHVSYSLTHPRFKTADFALTTQSFPELEDCKLDVPRYIFIREPEKFPHAIWDKGERHKNFTRLFMLYLESSRSIYAGTKRIYYNIFSAVLRITGVRILIHDTKRGLEFKIVNGKSLLYKALCKDGSSIEILD